LQEKQQQIAHVRRRVPVNSEENSFLAQITHAAEQVGIGITNLQSGQPQKRTGYSQLEITLSGLTTYESLCRFVDQVSQLDRMVRIVGMNLRTNTSQQQLYPVDITLAIYFGLNAS